MFENPAFVWRATINGLLFLGFILGNIIETVQIILLKYKADTIK